MLHPNQFQVNEAWILFRLNDAPFRTEQDGDFNIFALMDAASCFILASEPVSTSAAELSEPEAGRLLEEGYAQGQKLPETLFVPHEESASILTAAAEGQGITVSRVPEDELLVFIGEAREAFRERFGGSGMH